MTQERAKNLLDACQAFLEGWIHFLDHLDLANSNLDAESIRFMNEVPGKIKTAFDEALES